MRFQAALAIIGLAISVCACGDAGPTAPVAPAPAGDLASSNVFGFGAVESFDQSAISQSPTQIARATFNYGAEQEWDAAAHSAASVSS